MCRFVNAFPALCGPSLCLGVLYWGTLGLVLVGHGSNLIYNIGFYYLISVFSIHAHISSVPFLHIKGGHRYK